MGSLFVLSGVMVICLPILIWKSWDLNIMSSGDETAKSLGVEVNRLRNFTMIICSLVVAQNIMPPVILPIGVMTAFMGIPLFLYLIMRRRRGY